jgi:hypothetical protein
MIMRSVVAEIDDYLSTKQRNLFGINQLHLEKRGAEIIILEQTCTIRVNEISRYKN